MGGSSWSSNAYTDYETSRLASGRSAFTYHDDFISKTPYGSWKTHDDMNPLNVTRESRDSDAHPNSKAIAVFFDVTGSMGAVPRILQENLIKLMALLVEKNYVDDPQIMFGGIGDAYCDKAPLQVGQFESGTEMNDDLGKLLIEGGGGGQIKETYELGFYFLARHTSIDCWEKRGEKGYVFFIGDEQPYPKVNADQVAFLIGDNIQQMTIEEIIAELQEKYNVFFIIPNEPGGGLSSYVGDTRISGRWKELLNENVLFLDKTDAICETIALTIGLMEGRTDLEGAVADLEAFGVSKGAITSASKAVASVSHTEILIKAEGKLPSSGRKATVTTI